MKPTILNDSHSDALKVIAIMTMLIDHVGVIFFPGDDIYRIIGRLALPIFAYQLSIGYQHTSNKNLYLFRLWVFALISQIPYMLAFYKVELNILFILALSLLMIDQYAKKSYYLLPFFVGLVVLFEWSNHIPDFSYGLYGLLLPFFFYVFKDYKGYALGILTILTIINVLGPAQPIQVFAVVGVILCLYIPVHKLRVHLNKYVFYWFYPIHLLILWGIDVFLL